MGLSHFYFFKFLYRLCSFWIALLSNWCSNSLLAEWEKRETSLEKSKRFHAKCRKSGKMVKRKKVWRSKKKYERNNSRLRRWGRLLNILIDLLRSKQGPGVRLVTINTNRLERTRKGNLDTTMCAVAIGFTSVSHFKSSQLSTKCVNASFTKDSTNKIQNLWAVGCEATIWRWLANWVRKLKNANERSI